MNLMDFLEKIFDTFPPPEKCDLPKTISIYQKTMQTVVKYDYDKAFDSFAKNYKYRRLPSIGELIEALKHFIIRDNSVIEYRTIIAWEGKRRYEFGYNPAEKNYAVAKYELLNNRVGLIVHDAENEV